MKRLIATQLALLAALGAAVAFGQEPPPDKPFKAVHLVNLASASEEAALITALADMNQAVTKAGQPSIRYRLWKVAGQQKGSHAYLWESSWPGRAVYEAVHNHAEWVAAAKRHPEMEKIMKDEVYNRYVEVMGKK